MILDAQGEKLCSGIPHLAPPAGYFGSPAQLRRLNQIAILCFAGTLSRSTGALFRYVRKLKADRHAKEARNEVGSVTASPRSRQVICSKMKRGAWQSAFNVVGIVKNRWCDGGLEAQQDISKMNCAVLPIPCFAGTLSRPTSALFRYFRKLKQIATQKRLAMTLVLSLRAPVLGKLFSAR